MLSLFHLETKILDGLKVFASRCFLLKNNIFYNKFNIYLLQYYTLEL